MVLLIVYLLRITFENLWVIITLRRYVTLEEELWILLENGNRLYCHIHRPKRDNKWPGIVLVPSALNDGSVFDRWLSLNLRAKDIASHGYAVIHFDPEGRGRSDGTEDYGGSAHQNDLHTVLKYLSSLHYVNPNNVGMVSFSLGITMATGALARNPDGSEVKYLFDWEGPSNKYEVTMNNKIKFFKDYPTSNDTFWSSRQACNYIGRIRCGYFRFQCERDHVQGDYKQHAINLVNGALKGKAEWVKCNHNEVKFVIEEKRLKKDFWISSWSNQKLKMIQYINELCDRNN